MKRIGNLYDEIISLENLRLADEHARKGKLNTYGVKVHEPQPGRKPAGLARSPKSGNVQDFGI